MQINYKKEKIRKQCEDFKQAKKDFPIDIAKGIHKAINFIINSKNLDDIIHFVPFRFHDLKGDRKGEYAIDIKGKARGYRMVILPQDNSGEYITDNDIVFGDSKSITILEIKEVGNHYGD